MQGYWLFYAFSSLLGIAFVYSKSWLVVWMFMSYLVYLYYFKKWRKFQCFVLILFFLVFCCNMFVQMRNNHTNWNGTEENFSILFTDEVKVDGASISGYVKSQNGERLLVKYRVQSEEEKSRLSPLLAIGETCRVTGTLRKPKVATNENVFDYAAYLNHKHIFWELEVTKWHACKKQSGPVLWLKVLRHRLVTRMSHLLPIELASFVNASIFGERTLLDPVLSKSYQTLGIIHLLAISGFNVALMIGMFTYLLSRFGMTKEKIKLLLILFLPAFVFLSGWSPSIIRATFMALILLVQSFRQSPKWSGIDIASIVFVGYLLIEPFAFLDVGFQLSFIVTIGLLLSSSILAKLRQKPLQSLFFCCLISQVCSLPLVLYYYYEISWFSLVVNMLYIPLFSLVVLPVLLLVLFITLIVPALVPVVSYVINEGLIWLNQLTNLLATPKFQMLTLGKPHATWLLLYGFVSFYTCYQLEIKRKLMALLLIPCTLLIQLLSSSFSFQGEVTFLDVGQGDSILIRPSWKPVTYLIDTGGTIDYNDESWEKRRDPFEVGKDVVVPFLKSKGIRKIDKLILTHGDLDHVGGAISVLEAIKVTEVLLPKGVERSTLVNDIIRLASQKKCKVTFVARGLSWTENGHLFKVVSPSDEVVEEANNQSIVLYTELGGLRWLFTGDLEASGEEALLHRDSTLKVDVLKVGHHGSSSSTTEPFLDQLTPKVAIISVGANNRYGHPDPDIINRLQDKGIKVFRTDTDGSISYFFRGNQGTFSRRNP